MSHVYAAGHRYEGMAQERGEEERSRAFSHSGMRRMASEFSP